MIEYTKKQKETIARNVFNKLDADFKNADEHNKLRYNFFKDSYLKFLEDLQIRRDDIQAEIDSGVDTQTFFLRMRRHIILGDEVIENEQLLSGWSPEFDGEWKDIKLREAEIGRQEFDNADRASEEPAQAAE